MANWNNISVRKCASVYDIIMQLRGAGAQVPDPSSIAGEILNQGKAILNDEALWAALPDCIGTDTKQQVRDYLQAVLNDSR